MNLNTSAPVSTPVMDAKAEYENFFPSSLIFETPRIFMRIMEKGDKEHFYNITRSPRLWKFFTKDLSDENELHKWVEAALNDRSQLTRVPFTITDVDEKQICGSSSFGNISFLDKRVEIGWTWLGENYLGTGINQHVKFAMLSYAFEVMKMERVEFKTDNLNERSKAALKKIGAKEEGILRSHMQMHSNRRRDSVYFSILKSEWAEVKLSSFAQLL